MKRDRRIESSDPSRDRKPLILHCYDLAGFGVLSGSATRGSVPVKRLGFSEYDLNQCPSAVGPRRTEFYTATQDLFFSLRQNAVTRIMWRQV